MSFSKNKIKFWNFFYISKYFYLRNYCEYSSFNIFLEINKFMLLTNFWYILLVSGLFFTSKKHSFIYFSAFDSSYKIISYYLTISSKKFFKIFEKFYWWKLYIKVWNFFFIYMIFTSWSLSMDKSANLKYYLACFKIFKFLTTL